MSTFIFTLFKIGEINPTRIVGRAARQACTTEIHNSSVIVCSAQVSPKLRPCFFSFLFGGFNGSCGPLISKVVGRLFVQSVLSSQLLELCTNALHKNSTMKFWCYLDGKVRGRILKSLSSCLFCSFKWPDIDFSAPLLPVICVFCLLSCYFTHLQLLKTSLYLLP